MPPTHELIAVGGPGGSVAPVSTQAWRITPVRALRLLLLLLAVGQLGRIPALMADGKDAPILLSDLVLLAVLCLGAAVMVRRRRLLVDATAALAIAFATVGGTSTLINAPRFGLSSFELVYSLSYLARWLTYFGLYLLVINLVRREHAGGLWRAFELGMVAFAAFGLLQSAFLPNFALMIHPSAEAYTDWDPQGHRLVSTLLDPNFAGALLVMTLLVALARLAFGAPVEHWRIALWFAALGLTVSRGATLSFLVGLVVVVLARGLSRRLVRVLLVLAGVLAVVSPVVIGYAIAYNRFGIDPSAMSRVVGWIEALEIFSRHPVLGVGFNTYGFVREYYFGAGLARASFGLDGGLLFVGVLTGAVGLTLYLGMVCTVLRRCRRGWRNVELEPAARGMCAGAAAATVAIIVHGVFLNTLFFPFLLQPLWVLWGLGGVVQQGAGNGVAPVEPSTPTAPRLVGLAPGA